MNITSIEPWIHIPVAIVYCGLGALASGALFHKMSHLSEYTLNKTFGDYQNPKRTLDGRIIVSMPAHKGYYYIQNIALALIVAAVSSVAIQVLVLTGCPGVIAIPLLVGSVAAPILFGLINMLLCHEFGHQRWIELTDAEINENGINKNNAEKIEWRKHVYCGFGTSPEYFPGQYTHG